MATDTTQPILGTPFTPAQQIATQNANAAADPSYIPSVGATDMTSGTKPGQSETPIPGQTDQQRQAAVSAAGQQPAQQPAPDSAAGIAQKFTSGLQKAQDSGTPAPSSQGDAMAAVSTFAPTQPPAPPSQPEAPIIQRYQQDPNFQKILADQQAYMSVANQQQTAQETYDSISKQVSASYGQPGGLSDVDAKLMNWGNVINGTEDDIRNEISKTAGFATNSQVMAMTAVRNKLLIQNYNNLLNTKQDIENQIDKMVGFSQQDKQLALDTALKQVNFDQQNATYQQQMQKNAADAYQKIIDTPGYGYQALYASTGGDPHAINMVESALSLPPGSLAQLATIPDPNAQKNNLQNELLQSQISKSQADTENSKAQLAGIPLENQLKEAQISNEQANTAKTKAETAAAGSGANTNDPTTQAWTSAVLGGNATMAQVPAAYKNAVALSLNDQPAQQYSPLAASRFANAANKIAANYINLPQYQLTANGLPYLQRIDAAMKTPGSVSDQDLLDSLTKLNTAGNAISDAQIKLITDGKSFSDMDSSFSNKFKNGGVLSDNQRQQIQSIAKAIFANYQKGYQPVYDKAVAQMTAAGIPKAFQNIPDLNNLSAQTNNKSSGATPSQADVAGHSTTAKGLPFDYAGAINAGYTAADIGHYLNSH